MGSEVDCRGWRRVDLDMQMREGEESIWGNAKTHLIYGRVNLSFYIFHHSRLYLHCDLKYK